MTKGAGLSTKQNIIIAGAAPDTGNLGVSALLESTIGGISQNNSHQIVVLDHTNGIRTDSIIIDQGKTTDVVLCGARHSKRYYQPENLSNIRFSLKFFNLFNPIAKYFLSSKAILDISGGDSFTDLYGEWRFRAITLPKIIALENNIPLFLMPQTYGPFSSKSSEKIASDLVKGAAMTFARDEESFYVMKDLLDSEFDPERHKQGVDVAFLLNKLPPTTSLPSQVTDWINNDTRLTVGINISGLIYNQIENSYEQYGLKANYEEVVYQFIKKLLDETDVNIVLIPHVLVPENHFESDAAASKHLLNKFDKNDQRRIEIVENITTPTEIKWVISQMDWFCGTRMHSTIAALSSGVPTSAIAYSIKTRRVFKTCDQEQQVIDPRELDTQDVIDGLWECWKNREAVKKSLHHSLPNVLQTAQSQMALIRQKINTY